MFRHCPATSIFHSTFIEKLNFDLPQIFDTKPSGEWLVSGFFYIPRNNTLFRQTTKLRASIIEHHSWIKFCKNIWLLQPLLRDFLWNYWIITSVTIITYSIIYNIGNPTTIWSTICLYWNKFICLSTYNIRKWNFIKISN